MFWETTKDFQMQLRQKVFVQYKKYVDVYEI